MKQTFRYALAFSVVAAASSAGGQERTRTDCRQVGREVICDTKTVQRDKGIFEILRDASRRSDARKASRAAAANQQASQRAAFDLYAQRAAAIINFLSDSIGLDSTRLKPYWHEATTAVLTLYRTTPRASNQDIKDALFPAVMRYSRQR